MEKASTDAELGASMEITALCVPSPPFLLLSGLSLAPSERKPGLGSPQGSTMLCVAFVQAAGQGWALWVPSKLGYSVIIYEYSALSAVVPGQAPSLSPQTCFEPATK